MPRVKCDHCGNDYLQDRSTQRFCSKICSDRWWAAERRRGIEALRSPGREDVDAELPPRIKHEEHTQ